MSVDASALEFGRMKLLSREGESLRELRTEGEREKEGVCVGGGYTASLVGESSTPVLVDISTESKAWTRPASSRSPVRCG